jgi:hypothetical protein
VVEVAGEPGTEGGAHAWLGRLVEHGLRAGEQGPDVGRCQVEPVQLEAGPGQRPGQVRPLVAGRIVLGEGVDADHVVTKVEQRLGEMGADEAGGAGDDDMLATGTLHRPVDSRVWQTGLTSLARSCRGA